MLEKGKVMTKGNGRADMRAKFFSRVLGRLAGAILLVSWIGTDPVSAAEKPALAKTAVSDLAASCTPAAVQAIAARVPFRMTIGQIPNGPKLADGTKYVPATASRPGYCQVTGSIVTNPKSGKIANFLATLPDSWNRKYLQFGCFGHCGFFALNDATSPLVTIVTQGYPGQILEKGYASFGTDQGHIGGAGGTWAVKGPGQVDEDAIEDFLYRSDKVLAQAGKAFTGAFYTQATGRRQTIAYAYFCGCSGGGRDALVAASYFPEEFDGIVAGSPYGNMVNVGAQVVGDYLATLRSADADVPPQLVALIDPIVKAQCDALDGVKDGLIQNPAACNFRAARDLPRCAADKPGGNCFTKAQIETISTVLTAVTDKEGRVVQPGYAVSEVLPFFREGKRPADLNAPVPWDANGGSEAGLAPLGDAVLKIFANKNDPSFNTRSIFSFGSGGTGPVTDYRVIVPRAEVEKAYAAVRMGIGSDPRSAAKLIKMKRKLLIWRNASDEKLTPYMSYNYYKQLAAMYGGYDKLQKNIRLFLLPGTSHCSMGGEGPGNFDALSAIEDWVEKGRGPDQLKASLYSRTSPMIDPGKTPLRTMPLCKFPEMARYDGKGDVNAAASWSCSPADKRMLEIGESGRQAGVMP
jgi:feruloyl esterase